MRSNKRKKHNIVRLVVDPNTPILRGKDLAAAAMERGLSNSWVMDDRMADMLMKDSDPDPIVYIHPNGENYCKFNAATYNDLLKSVPEHRIRRYKADLRKMPDYRREPLRDHRDPQDIIVELLDLPETVRDKVLDRVLNVLGVDESEFTFRPWVDNVSNTEQFTLDPSEAAHYARERITKPAPKVCEEVDNIHVLLIHHGNEPKEPEFDFDPVDALVELFTFIKNTSSPCALHNAIIAAQAVIKGRE